MSTADLDPISRACRLLREGAAELKNCHTLAATGHDWTGEPEAKAAYDEHMATADALERWADSIGAGGVESLRGRQCLHRISEPAGEYPALPDVAWVVVEHLPVGGGWVRHERRQSYNADQMRAYVDADRAMRAAQPAGAQQPDAAYAAPEVLDALNWVDDFIARCNGDDRGACESVNVLRRAFASHGQAPAAAPAQAIGPCVICGSDEPFTGTCGSGGDPRALCKQPAPQQEAQEPYSIDADPQGIRALVADAITGALAFGAQGTNAPPDGHWLAPFWAAARAESEAAPQPLPASQGDAEDAARYRWLRERMLGIDFDWNESGITALSFEMPDGCAYGGCCNQNIDAARKQGANHD